MKVDDRVIEAARIALTQGRNLFAEGRGDQLEELLLLKCENPIAGMIGAHLVLITMAETPAPKHQALLDQVVMNLRNIVGNEHPDVEAVSLKASPHLQTQKVFTEPPFFRRSWQLIVEASRARPDLLDLALWDRIRATVTLGPYLVWAIDEPTRHAHLGNLVDAIEGAERLYAEPPVAADGRRRATRSAERQGLAADEPAAGVAEAAGLRRIPAAAVRDLWRQQRQGRRRR
jgi:hypothetical protein